jgi:hypothetical protein
LLDKLEKELEEALGKSNLMQEHHKAVLVEIQNTQFLNGAKSKEVTTENHLRQVADRESGKIKVEIEKLKRQTQEIQEKVIVNLIMQFLIQNRRILLRMLFLKQKKS